MKYFTLFYYGIEARYTSSDEHCAVLSGYTCSPLYKASGTYRSDVRQHNTKVQTNIRVYPVRAYEDDLTGWLETSNIQEEYFDRTYVMRAELLRFAHDQKFC